MYWIVNACFAGVQSLAINPGARKTLKRWVTFSKKEEAAIPPPPEMTPAMKKAMEEMNKIEADKVVKDVKNSVFNDK